MDTLILLQARTVRAVREISLSFSFFLVSKLIIASRRRISNRSRCRVFNNGTFIRCIVVYVSGSLRRPSIYSEGNLLREWIDPWKCVHFATRWWTWPNGSRVFLAFPYPSVLENIHRVPRKLNFVDSFCTRNDKKHWPMRVILLLFSDTIRYNFYNRNNRISYSTYLLSTTYIALISRQQ